MKDPMNQPRCLSPTSAALSTCTTRGAPKGGAEGPGVLGSDTALGHRYDLLSGPLVQHTRPPQGEVSLLAQHVLTSWFSKQQAKATTDAHCDAGAVRTAPLSAAVPCSMDAPLHLHLSRVQGGDAGAHEGPQEPAPVVPAHVDRVSNVEHTGWGSQGKVAITRRRIISHGFFETAELQKSVI